MVTLIDNVRKEKFESMRWLSDLRLSLAGQVGPWAGSYNKDWTGGIGFGGHIGFNKGLWLNNDFSQLLRVGAQADLSLMLGVLRGWINIIPGASAYVSWEKIDEVYTGYNNIHANGSGVSLSAGPALRYVPIEDRHDLDHGFNISLDIYDFERKERQSWPGDVFGGTLQYTLIDNDHIIFFGVKAAL